LSYQQLDAETFCHEPPASKIENDALKILERADWVDVSPDVIVISTPEGDEAEIDIFKSQQF
jgi:Mn-dependent DtxR family transcriptional regulator